MKTRHPSGAILTLFCCTHFILSTPFPALPEEPSPEEVPAEPAETPPETPATATPPTNDAAATGMVTTAPEVSPFTGSLSYSYPIVVPPGRNGIAPNLTLTYSSQAKNSWLGRGWMLDLGSIQRSTRYGLSYAVDGDGAYVASINGSTSDLVPRSDWGPGCYGAKVEGAFSRYCKTGNNAWTVTANDGTKYFYGSTADSRQDDPANPSGTFKWCLDKVEDTNGNYMTITYQKDQGEIYPLQIDYTGNTKGLTPTRRILFITETRPDAPALYVPRFKVVTAKRLSAIEILSNNEPAASYSLAYAEGTPSRVTTITRMGTDATPLPPDRFTYSESSALLTKAPSAPPLAHAFTHLTNDKTAWAGDFNGDAKHGYRHLDKRQPDHDLPRRHLYRTDLALQSQSLCQRYHRHPALLVR